MHVTSDRTSRERESGLLGLRAGLVPAALVPVVAGRAALCDTPQPYDCRPAPVAFVPVCRRRRCRGG